MTTKNRVGERDGMAQALSSFEDRIRQIQSLMPGVDGGGSVATPFKIGGYTFDEGGQIDLTRLADIARPGDHWEPGIFEPTIAQGVTTDIAYTTNYSDVLLTPDEVVWDFFFTITGTGTAGSGVALTLPFRTYHAASLVYVGQVQIYDDSGADRYSLEAESFNSGTQVRFGGESTTNDLWGAVPSIALDVDDQIRGKLRYRATTA